MSRTRFYGMILCVVLWTIVLSHCSFQPLPPTLKIQLEPRSLARAPDDFCGYLVTVSGEGITEAYPKHRLAGVLPACLNLGAASAVASLASFGAGVPVSVLAGLARTVIIWGIQRHDGGPADCAGTPFDSLFDTYVPTIKQVARQTLDLTESKTVRLAYQEQTEDRIWGGPCFPTNPTPAKDAVIKTPLLGYWGRSGPVSGVPAQLDGTLPANFPILDAFGGVMESTSSTSGFTEGIQEAGYHLRIDLLFQVKGLILSRFQSLKVEGTGLKTGSGVPGTEGCRNGVGVLNDSDLTAGLYRSDAASWKETPVDSISGAFSMTETANLNSFSASIGSSYYVDISFRGDLFSSGPGDCKFLQIPSPITLTLTP